MKGFIAMMLLLSVSFSYTYAGEEYESYEKKEPTRMEDREVISWDHGLELKLDGDTVSASWNKFPQGMGFDWFKLVYSTTNSKPVYPTDATIFVGSRTQTETSFKLKDGNTHYIRLCAVILNNDYSKDRYCGDVHTFEKEYVADEKQKEEYKKEYVKKQEYSKEYEAKKQTTVKQYSDKKVTKPALRAVMKNRIDSVIENFVEKLEGRGYTDAQMTSAINTVISRLGEFKNKTGYTEIVAYMISVLEEYREEYDNPLEDLESIFEGL